jgi:hypothetical protein
MKVSYSIILAVQCLTVLARPSPNNVRAAASMTPSAAGAKPTAAAGKEEEKKDANEVEQAGQFGVKINLGGGNIKTDTLFPPGVSAQHPSFAPRPPKSRRNTATNHDPHA